MSEVDAASTMGEGEEEDFIALRQAQSLLRDKILHTLRIWPRLSPSMLQVGIGTAVSPKLWHPILERLITEGAVVRDEIRAKSHIGRDQVYVVLHLPDADEQ